MPVLDSANEDKEPAAEKPTGSKDTMSDHNCSRQQPVPQRRSTSEVSACIACHGPFGEGNKPASFPALKSQHADYLIKALNDFKSGARSNNPENIMHMIAKKMTAEEIKAVSYRISMMK